MPAQNNSRLIQGLRSGEAGEAYKVGQVRDLMVADERAAAHDEGRFPAHTGSSSPPRAGDCGQSSHAKEE
jgi:hypothetical protein